MQNSMLQWLSSKLLERPLQPRELLTARKVVYTVLILILFTASFFWRRAAVDARAIDLAIRQDSRGEVELSGEIIRLSLTGSRGIATCVLWYQAIEKQKKNQWNELEFLVRSLTKLQPYFIRPWLFQSWNLAYNVSVDSDRINDKYFYITRGIDLLAEGERQNRFNPDMRYSIGFYGQHKIMQHDQTNVLRSLFQLSMIQPSERDPDRFLKRAADGGEEIDWIEFEKFITKHPQLARRLHSGQLRDTKREHQNQFTCRDAEEVIRFLRDNWRVPGIYELPEKRPGVKVEAKDVLLPPEGRFPPLPPPRANPYKPAGDAFQELTSETTLDDTVDGHVLGRAWYGYAQEPLPPIDALPGSSKPITDRVRQRKPANMTTLLFRNYPCLAQSSAAERLQQEGWFRPDADEEAKAEKENRTAEEYWDFPEDSSWFRKRGNRFTDPQTGKPGKARARLVLEKDQHADVLWDLAARIWTRHGEANHLLFEDPRREAEMYQNAAVYCKKFDVAVGAQLPPPPGGEESLSGDELKQYKAAQYLFEYKFYRDLSNFVVHFNHPKIERQPTTIAARKLFFQAETAYLEGDLVKARATYEKPAAVAAWRDEVLLGGKRDNDGVLRPKRGAIPTEHRIFRDDVMIQEYTFETQLRYMQFFSEQNGSQILKGVFRTGAGMVVPLTPPPGSMDLLPWGMAPYAIESEWTAPPIMRAFADFRGPFDVLVFDMDEKEQHLLACGLLGTAGNPGPAAALLSLTLTEAWSKPLISDQARASARERRNLNPAPKQAPKDGEAEK